MNVSHEKEELILKTAMVVFIEKGRHGAKMQEIADRAGVNKALLHYYFRSKENIYARVFEYLFRKFFLQLSVIADDDLPFEQTLRLFIAKYTDIIKETPQIPLFILRELSEDGSTAQNIVDKLLFEKDIAFPNKMVAKVTEAIEKGEIREVDPKQFILTLIGSSVFFFVAEPIFTTMFKSQDSFDRAKFIEDRKEAIFQMLYYGLKPRGENL